MQYLIDDANLDKIKEVASYFPIEGVTTNPSIIAANGENVFERIKKIREIIGPDKFIHAQVLQNTCEGMLEDAKKLKAAAGENFFVKIPITKEGLKAMAALKKEGYNVTATAIFSVQQALISAKAGADFVAPYVNRLDNFTADGINVVAEIVSIFEEYGIDSQVIGASFKNTQQVHNAALVGAHAVTLNSDLFAQLITHPLTTKAIDEFEQKGTEFYK